MIRGFIFDLDGVLVDTPDLHYQAWKKLTDALKIRFTRNDYENLKGLGRISSFQQILKSANRSITPQEFEHYLHKKNGWYLNLLNDAGDDIILPGVHDFLEESKSLNLVLAVGSASKNAVSILRQTQLSSYFSVVEDGNTTTHFKPNPEVFQSIAKQLNLSPDKLIVFEDSKAGVSAAKSGGFKCVGIGSNGSLPKANLVVSGLESIGPGEILLQIAEKHFP